MSKPKPIAKGKVSPDWNQSRDYMEVRVHKSRDALNKCVFPGGITEPDMEAEAFFQSPKPTFKARSGRKAGVLCFHSPVRIGAVAHECTHAGHFYITEALKVNKANRRFRNSCEMHEWYAEGLAQSTECLFEGVMKFLKQNKVKILK